MRREPGGPVIYSRPRMGVAAHPGRSAGAAALACCAMIVTAPAAVADERVVAGPSVTYVTPNPTMDQGEPLTFLNLDFIQHDVTATDKGADGKPLFSTPLIGPLEEAFVQGSEFLSTGAYGFICSIHPNMVGTLTVTGAGAPHAPHGSGGGAARDVDAPSVSVRVVSTRLAAVRRSRKLTVEVRVDEAARVRLKAVARAGGRKVALASGLVELPASGSRRPALALTRAGRKALKGRRRVGITVTARAQDPAGNTRADSSKRALGR